MEWARIAGVFALVFTASLLLLNRHFLQLPATEATPRHAIIIDAGSSGTRVHVYEYRLEPDDIFPSFALPDSSLKTKPGLSAYADDPGGAARSLAPLLDHARGIIPAPDRTKVPIMLYATAGLRLLSEESANAVLESVRDELSGSGFAFQRDWADIITGTEEGLFAWLAANFGSGALQERALLQSDRKTVGRHHGSSPMVGVIEMGGASAQVTFEPEPSASLPPSGLQHLRLPGAARPIYTHSFLGLGMDTAIKAAAAAVRADADAETDPCVPPGAKSLEGLPGGGNYAACRAIASRLVLGADPAAACDPTPPCTIAGARPPPFPRGLPLIATENFHYSAAAFGLPPDASLADFGEAGATWCSTDIGTLREAHAAQLGDAEFELSKWCFSAAYIDALLRDALGLADMPPLNAANNSTRRGTQHTRTAPLTFTNTVPGARQEGGAAPTPVPVDWALGAALRRAMQERDSDPALARRPTFSSLAVAGGIAVTASLVAALAPATLVRLPAGFRPTGKLLPSFLLSMPGRWSPGPMSPPPGASGRAGAVASLRPMGLLRRPHSWRDLERGPLMSGLGGRSRAGKT